MELTAAILAYIMHGQVEMMLIRTMNDSFMMYNDKDRPYVATGIDFLQTNVSRICSMIKQRGLSKEKNKKQKTWKMRKLDPRGQTSPDASFLLTTLLLILILQIALNDFCINFHDL